MLATGLVERTEFRGQAWAIGWRAVWLAGQLAGLTTWEGWRDPAGGRVEPASSGCQAGMLAAQPDRLPSLCEQYVWVVVVVVVPVDTACTRVPSDAPRFRLASVRRAADPPQQKSP